MSKILQKSAKLLCLIYISILALCLVFACFFMTQYKDIHIGSNNGVYNSGYTIGDIQNTYLFKFFATGTTNQVNGKVTDLEIDSSRTFYNEIIAVNDKNDGNTFMNSTYKNGKSYAKFIDEFRIDLNNFNDNIVTYACVCVALIALLFVFANSSRKIYYISNLVVGIAVPAGVAIYSIVMLANCIGLQVVFNNNVSLFKVTSAMMNNLTDDSTKELYLAEGGNARMLEAAKGVNDTTFILGDVIFGMITIISILMVLYTIYRYKASSTRRQEVIERAVQNND